MRQRRLTGAAVGWSALLLFTPVSPLVAQGAKLYPSDEAARDPSLFMARAGLLEAIAERDTAALLAGVAPNIKNGFGGNDGIDEFRKAWRLDSAGSPLWSTLGGVLALGGGFLSESIFVAPYVFHEFPDSLDGFEHLAVMGRGVRVRAGPDVHAPVVAALAFDIVARDRSRPEEEDAGGRRWVPVRLPGADRGYVAAEYLRGPTGYRAGLVRHGGRWRIGWLLAGD